jgi:transposase
MLRHFIEYKAKLRNCVVVIADRFFPSSKTCSKCGAKKENLTLADRIFSCDCGLVIDRDLNAAINLNNYGCKVGIVATRISETLNARKSHLRLELSSSDADDVNNVWFFTNA